MAIDEPVDKIRDITNEDEKDPLGGFLQVAGVAHPLFAMVAVVKGLLDGERRWEKIRAALRAVADELMRIQERWPQDVKAAVESDWFKRALSVLIAEADQTSDDDHARMLGRAIAQACFPNEENKHRQEDLASYIRDLARLGTDDIRMLKLMREVYEPAIRTTPNMHDPNYFTQHFGKYKTMVQERGIHSDDAVSLGVRLSGFGLACEVPRNTTHQAPGEYCFRPTRRGLYLLSLLEAAELPLEKQN